MDRALTTALTIYGAGCVIGYIRFEFFWAASKRRDAEARQQLEALSDFDPSDDDEVDGAGEGDIRDDGPLTLREKLISFGMRVGLGVLLALHWPFFLAGYVWAAIKALFTPCVSAKRRA